MSRKIIKVLIAPIALVLLAACGGHSGSLPPQKNSASAQVAPGVRASSLLDSENGSLFKPNSIKYSDTGAHPATGRSGSATIESRALIAKDGTTLVESTTGTLDGAIGAGQFRHVQAKIYDIAGTPQRALNYNDLSSGYWSETYSGIGHNDTIHLMHGVSGIDEHRTDVVSTTDTAKLRPDLSITRITAPTRAYAHQPVSVTAYVSELNGDVGARTDCILSVDGVQVAQALAIWIDASRTVACAFQPIFATTGPKKVVVTAANVIPGDWDTSNNSSSTTIEIVDPVVNLGYFASAYNTTLDQTYSWSYTNSYSGSSYSRHSLVQASDAAIIGNTRHHQFAFPVQVTADVKANGSSIAGEQNVVVSDGYDDGNTKCGETFSSGGYTRVCASDSGTVSSAYFDASRGDVTYFDSYAGYYCSPVCTGYGYIVNGSFSYGNVPSWFDIGSSDQFNLKVVDAAGTTYEAVTGAIDSIPFSDSNNFNNCHPLYYGETYCYSNIYKNSGKTVYTSAAEPTY